MRGAGMEKKRRRDYLGSRFIRQSKILISFLILKTGKPTELYPAEIRNLL